MPSVLFFLHSISFSNELVVHFPGPDNFYRVTRSQILRLPPAPFLVLIFLWYLGENPIPFLNYMPFAREKAHAPFLRCPKRS